MTRKRSPWARIVLADRKGTGVRLSADDVSQLARDEAIVKRGELDLAGADSEDDAKFGDTICWSCGRALTKQERGSFVREYPYKQCDKCIGKEGL